MPDLDQLRPFNTPRVVVKNLVPKSIQELEGIAASKLDLDPFLLLYRFSVTPPAAGSNLDHPHRGFDSVTYVLQGSIAYQDFTGIKSQIKTGDVQWVTTGRGIVHSESGAEKGTNIAVQIWINLPSKEKWTEPKYHEVLSNDIPTAEQDGVKVKVLAGEALGVHSSVFSKTSTLFLDFTLKPGAQLHHSIPESWNSFVYVIEGEGIFGSLSSSPVTTNNVLVLGHGDGLSVWNKALVPLRFLLLGGQPLNEPVVQQGPFVLNTQSEIEKTIEDYNNFKNGFEKRKDWRSQQ